MTISSARDRDCAFGSDHAAGRRKIPSGSAEQSVARTRLIPSAHVASSAAAVRARAPAGWIKDTPLRGSASVGCARRPADLEDRRNRRSCSRVRRVTFRGCRCARCPWVRSPGSSLRTARVSAARPSSSDSNRARFSGRPRADRDLRGDRAASAVRCNRTAGRDVRLYARISRPGRCCRALRGRKSEKRERPRTKVAEPRRSYWPRRPRWSVCTDSSGRRRRVWLDQPHAHTGFAERLHLRLEPT